MEDKLDQDDYAEDVGDADEYNDDMRGVNHDAAEQVESFDAVEPPEEERFEPPLKASAAPGLAAADGADAVPVVLDFVMGKVRLSLGDLRTLGPGTILTIDGGSPASIQVISGGHVLGRGEAVDVGGQLGIRIVDWTAR